MPYGQEYFAVISSVGFYCNELFTAAAATQAQDEQYLDITLDVIKLETRYRLPDVIKLKTRCRLPGPQLLL